MSLLWIFYQQWWVWQCKASLMFFPAVRNSSWSVSGQVWECCESGGVLKGEDAQSARISLWEGNVAISVSQCSVEQILIQTIWQRMDGDGRCNLTRVISPCWTFTRSARKSCFGVWWCVCPDVFYSNGMPSSEQTWTVCRMCGIWVWHEKFGGRGRGRSCLSAAKRQVGTEWGMKLMKAVQVYLSSKKSWR